MDFGRGKGRGRQKPAHQQQEGAEHPPSHPSRGEQPSGAWSRRPGPPASQPGHPQSVYSRPASQPQSGSSVKGVIKTVARGMRHSEAVAGPSGGAGPSMGEPMDVVPSGGGEGDTAHLGRGALRGRRVLPPEILSTRPPEITSKKGKTGRAVMVQANYFKLLSTTDWCLYQYRVDFAPEEDRTIVRKGLLRLHKETLGSYIFDGTVLYTSNRLPDKLELFSIRESDKTQIRMDIKLVGDMMKGDYHYLQFFNIIMRKCLGHLKLQLVGRNYFDARDKIEIPEFRLELWPGYITSIRQHEQDILMCSEISHKVMRQQTLLDILNECYTAYGGNFKAKFHEMVCGFVVLTDYNNNTYRIEDVDFEATPASTFQLRTGEKVSYKDYYFNKYQIRITNVNQPMLVTRNKPRDRRAGQPELVYLVPELCRATGLTDNMRNNFQLTSALAKYTRVSPQSRIERLMNFNRRLRSAEPVVKEFKDWNLKLDDRLVDVPARTLLPEKIFMTDNKNFDAGNEADWTRNLRNLHMFRVAELKSWSLVCTQRARRSVQAFLSDLQKAAGGLRFAVTVPYIHDIRDDRSSTYTEMLEEIMSRSNPQMILCVVPNNRSDRYIAIKKKCCVDRPVPTQVMMERNLTKGLSVATKVAIQLNCKLGGAPWFVDIPASDLMVVGFDVCHDTSKKTQDYGAMVASLDKQHTRYYSAVSAHKNGEELSNDLAVHLCKAVHKFRELNGKFPARIIIYRDGVGEGQVPFVYQHEVEHLKRQLGQLYGDPAKLRMAFLIVNKRLNTRLFANRGNPPPGTVVDDVITSPEKYDFFIVSQHVRQGTVSPTSYSVLFDNCGFAPDILQRLTYKLCHMYFNWSGTIRVPAPCQYAHKLAALVAQFIHQPPSARMDTLLYFL